MLAAGGIGDKIAAAASFHGGRLAVADDPRSPHLAADRIAATVYVAGAIEDARSRPSRRTCSTPRSPRPEWTTRSSSTRPIYGFAVADNDTYDEKAAERHWVALRDLYSANL